VETANGLTETMGKKLQSKKNSSTGGRNSKTTRNDKKDSNNDQTWVDELRLHPILGCHHPTVIIDDHNTNRDNKEDSGSGSASASRTGGILPTTTTPTSCPNEPNDEPVSISIVSWNVLAEAYCSRRSHRNLPHYYQQHVFSTLRRRALIKDILVNKLAVLFDVICLQEVDRSEISNSLRDCGYRCIETPRSIKGNSGGRVDSCLICVKEQNWTILDYELIRLDDLATLASSSTTTASSSASESESGSQINKQNGDDNLDSKTSNSKNSNCNIQGIQQAFLRRNVALVVRLASVKDVNKTVVIANAHLFWNPSYEYVKVRDAFHLKR
jgi:mRNA deadenylase 3'-5' endonuclease subunit Ccr4